MKYSKRRLGKELKEELEKGYDIVKISRWAFRIFFDRLSELDETESNILEELFRMEDDPQFELTKEEIYKIADKLILEGEKEEFGKIPISTPTLIATDLGERWLMCPSCQEVWQSQSTYPIVECPKCNEKIQNPKNYVT